MAERTTAQTIGELDVHLGYLRDEIARLSAAVATMATSDDIKRLTDRIDTLASKRELEEAEKRWASGSVRSTFERGINLVTRLGAALVVLASMGGFVVAVVHYLDKIK